MTAWWMPVLVAGACEPRSAVPSALDPAIAQAANERLELVRRAVAAYPPRTATLPTCSPSADVWLLSAPSADVMTGGAGDPKTPGFARPNKQEGAFHDLRSTDGDTVRRGVSRLASLRGLALFAADEVVPPVATSWVLISPATVAGRVVVFDLNAQPTCMSPITVTGGAIASVHVKKPARSDEVQRAFEYAAEQDLARRLDLAISVVVNSAERP